jgi:hypothetical protein
MKNRSKLVARAGLVAAAGLSILGSAGWGGHDQAARHSGLAGHIAKPAQELEPTLAAVPSVAWAGGWHRHGLTAVLGQPSTGPIMNEDLAGAPAALAAASAELAQSSSSDRTVTARVPKSATVTLPSYTPGRPPSATPPTVQGGAPPSLTTGDRQVTVDLGRDPTITPPTVDAGEPGTVTPPSVRFEN